jgi:hypothetical protein
VRCFNHGLAVQDDAHAPSPLPPRKQSATLSQEVKLQIFGVLTSVENNLCKTVRLGGFGLG